MAVLSNVASGNFTTAATWGVVEATTWTQLLATQESGTTALTTAFQASATFTVPAIQTLQGMLIKVASRVTTAGNTLTARIYNVTGAAVVANTTVTIDVLDMQNGIGWVYLKFPANATLNTATTYRVEIASNVASSATLYRKNATAANWTFGLVTTTNQAPAAADQIVVVGENSGFNVYQTLTVTVNNTAATVFGPNVAGAAAIEVSAKGVLAFSTAAGAAYRLTLDGNLVVNELGTFTMGTIVSPMDSSSSATLTFDVASNVQYGLNIRQNGIVTTYGTPKTTKSTLASSVIPGGTTLTTNDSTGWLSGDVVAVAATARNSIAFAETVTLSADATGTSVPVSALANVHDGSASATQARAHVINLTRNVKILGVSTALNTYIVTPATSATINFTNTQFQYMGSGTAGSRGIDLNIISGAFNMTGCAITNFEAASATGVSVNVATPVCNIQNTVFYRCNLAAVNLPTTVTSGTMVVNDCAAIGGTGMYSTAIYNINANIGTFTNLVGSGGSVLGFAVTSLATGATLTISDLTFYSCVGTNITINTISELTESNSLVSNILSYRSAAEGVILGSVTTGACINTILNGGRIFGNATRGLTIGFVFSSFVKNFLIYNEAGYDQPNGIAFNNHVESLYVDDSQIGVALPHSVSDVRDVCPRNEHNATFRNCLFGSTTEFSNQSLYTPGSAVGSARHEQTAGVHKMFKKFGTITLDNSFYKVQAPSQRLTPTDATNKLYSQEKRIAVPTGGSALVSVWVRKSTIADGTPYNGNEVQIKLLADPAIGIASDTILATSSAYAFGTFEKITGTTPAITDNGVVRIVATCDGTTGWANIDLWTVTIV